MNDGMLDDVRTSELENVIYEYIHHKRNREILHDHFCDGLSYGELSKKFNLHENTIKSVISKNEWKIYKHLDLGV